MKKHLFLFFIVSVLSASDMFGQTCSNEDFEDAALTYSVPYTATITTTNGINGWTANSGTVNSTFIDHNCLIGLYTYTKTPDAVKIMSAGTGGVIDPRIGPGYPIYSVFGGSLNATATSIYGFNSYGDWFVKLNHNSSVNTTLNRIKKTINVTAANANFNFAYLAVMDMGHSCCEAAGASVIFKDCTGTIFATYSVSAGTPIGSCSIGNTDTIISETTNDTTITKHDSLYVSPYSASVYYTKWMKRSIDLSPWIGSCVEIEVSAFDCAYNGHFATAYFDAQCGPSITTNIAHGVDPFNLKVYPNPSSGNFNIDAGKYIEKGEFELKNILGQVVHKQSIKHGVNQVITENLAKGIYNYTILNNKEVMSIGKIVIE